MRATNAQASERATRDGVAVGVRRGRGAPAPPVVPPPHATAPKRPTSTTQRSAGARRRSVGAGAATR